MNRKALIFMMSVRLNFGLKHMGDCDIKNNVEEYQFYLEGKEIEFY